MKIIRIITLVTSILIASILAWVWLPANITVEGVGRDFAAYWASGHLLLQGENPYSAEKVLAVQQSLGWSESEPTVIYNPPWVLTFLLPFCVLDFAVGKILWMACLLTLILFSADRLWLIYGGSPEKRQWALLIALSFSPVLFAYRLGQIVPLMLLGLVGFLQGIRGRSWWLAGMPLVLIAVKPHTVYLFWFALLFWSLQHRRWPVLLGCALALLCATLPPLFYNPDVIRQYVENILTKSYALHWATPTLGTFLRFWFGSQQEWLQYMPTLAGLTWFVVHWRKHRDGWVWDDQLPILILVSLMTHFYTWPSDYLMILPAVIQGAAWMLRAPGVRHAAWMLSFYAAIHVLAVVSTHFLSFHFYVWMPFALWLNYMLLKQQRVSENPSARGVSGFGAS